MDVLLILILVSIFTTRIFWLFVIKDSGKISFIFPLILEFLFVYPYVLIDILGLEWSYFGIISLYMITLAVQLGLFATDTNAKGEFVITQTKRIYPIIVLFLSVIFVNITISHPNLVSIFNGIGNLFVMANENAIARYSGNLGSSLLSKVTTILSFSLAFIIGSLCANKLNNKNRLIFFVYISILIIDSLIMAARAGLLLQMAALISSFVVTKYVTTGSSYFRVTTRKIMTILCCVVGVFIFFVIVQVFRGGNEEYDILGISSHIVTWFIGYIPAYDMWLKNMYSFEYTFGLRTFAGIADVLNINVRQGGVYEPVTIGEGRVTNVYTAYRGLIEDFSLPGMYVILIALTMVLGGCLDLAKRKGMKIYVIICVMVLYFFLWSFVINPYIYNTILAALLLYGLIFYRYFRFERSY
ncbi:hypothetical protein A1OS_21750 [Enterovibrio norvegicus]|uniref:O-antigen polymerase n=1 Tax=Enterovibrio norvegicus TaxID=188144 RepID=UPI0002E34DE6|nr:O-antigen polymerase [Enterovibrio norvegicus]OEE57330.1 hypothetical protein A1OS_21750 [Enterovibrio norvegicus]